MISSLFTKRWYNKVLIKAFSGQRQPVAGSSIEPSTKSCNPSGPETLYLSGISETSGLIL